MSSAIVKKPVSDLIVKIRNSLDSIELPARPIIPREKQEGIPYSTVFRQVKSRISDDLNFYFSSGDIFYKGNSKFCEDFNLGDPAAFVQKVLEELVKSKDELVVVIGADERSSLFSSDVDVYIHRQIFARALREAESRTVQG